MTAAFALPRLAEAAASNDSPTSGETVTVDTSPPNPETNGIFIADGVNDVKINILPGAIIETFGGPAIRFGDGTHDDYLDNQGVIRTTGDNAPAIQIAPGGVTGRSSMVLTKSFFGVVETSGNDSPGVVYGNDGGHVGNGSFVMLDGPRATIATTGDRSPGYVFNGMSTGSGDAFIGVAGHRVSVTTQGHDSAGIIFNAWGDMDTQETLFVDFDMTANTFGDRSPGVIFGANPANAPGTLVSTFQSTDTGFYVTTQGDDSVGLIFGPSALPSGEVNIAAVAFGGNVVTSGNNSHGVIITEGLSNAQPGQIVNITLTANGPTNFMTAATSGDNSHGIILGDGLGTNRTDMNFVSSLRIGSAWSATTSGTNSHALVISENTTLTLDAANIGALTANGTIVNGSIETFDGFVATGAGSRAVMNHGILYGTFTVGDAIVGNLGNNGLIESADGAGGVAVQFTGTTNDFFELQTQGVVIGTVEAGAGTDTFILGGTGAASFDVGLIGTQYNDFEAFEKTGSSTWTLTGTNAITAPFLVSEGTLANNATLENMAFTVDSGATLAGIGTVGDLTLNSGGTLAPGNSTGTPDGSNDFVVSRDYTNANFGVGNAFDARANVVGSGQIVGENADVTITGAVTPAGANAFTLNLGNVRQGDSTTVNYQIANDGTGADIRGAVQTATGTGNITDARLSGAGVTAHNFGPITAGGDSGNLGVSFDATTAGALAGQSIAVISNFDNVAPQIINLSGMAFQVAQGHLNTAPLNFGTLQVGQVVQQALSISNIATGPTSFVEDLNASFGASSGAGAGQILGTGSINGLLAGNTDASNMVVNVNTGTAGAINGAIAVNYFSAGAVNGNSNDLGVLAVGSDSYGVSGTIQATGQVINAANPVINTAQPIQLGNVRIGAASPTALVSVTNQTTTAPQAALNASISGNAPITASGSFNLLGPGQINSSALQVGMNTGTAGAVNGAATIVFVSDASNVGGCEPNCQMTLASQDVQVTGAVYRLASPDVDTAQPVVLAARVGDAAPTQNLNVTNQSPDAFTEGLKADIGSVDAGFAGSGNIDNLVAGGTDTTSLTVGLADTSTSQNISGNVTLGFQSTGAGTTEATDIAVGSEAVQVQGRVYQQAEAQVNTPSVNFGIVHVGDVVGAQKVSATNAAPVAVLNDTLAGGFVNLPAGPFDGSGSVSGLGAGQTDAANLAIGLDTSSAGIFNSSGQYLQFASENPDMADLDLGMQALSLFAQVNNYANPWFALDSGFGSLSIDGFDFVVDYGTLFDDVGSVGTSLSFSNNVTGPADLLRGSYDLTGIGTPFVLSGFGDFDDLFAGDAISGLSFAFNTADLGFGAFSESIALTAFGFNASNFEQQLNVSLTFQGQIRERDATAVSEPPALLLMLLGLLALAGLRYRRASFR